MNHKTNRTRIGLTIAMTLLLTLGINAGVYGTPTGPTAPTPCGSAATATLPQFISGTTTRDCKTIEIDQDTTVVSGGELILTNTRLEFVGGHGLTVASGGFLRLDDVTVHAQVANNPDTAWDLTVAAGASAHLNRVRLIDTHGIDVATDDFTANDTRLERGHSYGFRLDGGDADFVRTSIEGAPAALVLRNQANVSMQDVLIKDASIFGIDASSSELSLRRVKFDDVATPFRVSGDAFVRADHVWTTSSPGKAVLAPASGGAEAPILEVMAADPPWVAADSDIQADEGVLRLGWLPIVRVLEDTPAQDLWGTGVDVEVRRTPEAAPLGQARTDAASETPPFRVIEAEVTSTGTTTHPDPYVFLRDAHNVKAAQVQLHGATVWEVLLPNDPDDAPPFWDLDAGDVPLTAPAWTHDGVARLSWQPATDGPDENRRVNYYEILRFGDEAPAVVATAFGTQADIPLGDEGPIQFQVRPVDLALNVNQDGSNTVSVRLDPEGPSIDTQVQGTAGPNATWFRSDTVTITADADDAHSGLAAFEVRTPGENTFTDATDDPYVESAEGQHTYVFRARDAAGNQTTRTVTVGLDRVPPDVEDRFDPPLPDGDAGWYTEPPILIVDATDDTSGIHASQYRLGTGDWTPFTDNATIATPGSHILTLNVTDAAGNSRLLQRRVQVDAEAPSLDVEWIGNKGTNDWWKGPATAVLSSQDGGAGVREMGYRTPAETWTQTEDRVIFDHARNTTVAFHAVDHAGNEETTPFVPLKIDREAPIAPVVDVQKPEAEGASYRLNWALQPAVDAMSGIASLEVHRSIDGSASERVVTAPSGASSVLVPVTPQKTNEFFVRAIDHAGWTADSNTVRIVSQVAAGTSLDLPADDPIRIRGDHTFTANPPDATNVTSVSFYIDGLLAAALADAPYVHTVDASTLPNGVHSLAVVVAHADGTTREESYQFEVHNGYTAVIADSALYVAGIVLLSALGAAAAFLALRRLRAMEETA